MANGMVDGMVLAAGASQPGASWPPRGDHPSIPEAELPPWLREGQPAASAARGPGNSVGPREPLAGSPPEDYAGFAEFQGFDAGDMPMDPMEMLPPESAPGGLPSEHYADRFGIEMPGGSGRFGYEYDYGQAGAASPPAMPPEPPPPTAKNGRGNKGGKRKGLFRRRG